MQKPTPKRRIPGSNCDHLDGDCLAEGWRKWLEVAVEAERLGLDFRGNRGRQMASADRSENARMLTAYNLASRALYKLAKHTIRTLGGDRSPANIHRVSMSMLFQSAIREALIDVDTMIPSERYPSDTNICRNIVQT